MESESSASVEIGRMGLGNEESDLLARFSGLSKGWRTLAEETIYTEEMFLEFVQHMETDVRKRWTLVEFELHRTQKDAKATSNEHEKSGKMLENIREQLEFEMERKRMAEDRCKSLEGLLDTFREMLGGGRHLTDEERKRLFDSTEELRRPFNPSNNKWSGMRKSEDIDADRISFDRSDEEALDEDEEMEELPPRQEQRRQSRRISTRTSLGEGTKYMRVTEGEGDIEIIARTHVHIPENGQVNAQTFLTAKPRKSVGFSDPVSSTFNVRRSQSVPRFVEDTEGNRMRRSKEEAELLSSEVSSQVSDEESLVSDFRNQEPTSSNIASRLTRRRSKSIGNGLNGRVHNFLPEFFVSSTVCKVCHHKLQRFSKGRKCSTCGTVCHVKCEASAPIPCMPIMSNPYADKAGGQIFDLEKMVSEYKPRVPAVVSQSVNYINQRGLTEEGLYRIPGQQSRINDLKSKYYAAYKRDPKRAIIDPNILAKVNDVHDVVGFLKKFILSLTEPLLTYKLWHEFADAAASSGFNEFYRLIKELPGPNRDTLAYLMQHFHRVADSPQCRMPTENLQKVIAPTLIGNSSPTLTLKQQNPAEMFREQNRQLLIASKLFHINRKYWADVQNSDARLERPSTLRYSGDGISGLNHGLGMNDSTLTDWHDAQEDSMVMEGGATMRNGGTNSFLKTIKLLSGSKLTLNTVTKAKPKPNTEVVRGIPKFQSPHMSD